MPTLEGKTIVVTGAAGGIGSLVADGLQRQGARVIGMDRQENSACSISWRCDLSTRTGIAEAAFLLETADCDILVNLAGVQHFGTFVGQPPDALWKGYVVNLLAPAMLIQSALPGMLARGRGHVVNIGSVLGSIPFAHFVGYSSAKAGLKGLSDALRRELADKPIAVTHISPRAVKTNLATSQVREFATLTGMRMDDPHIVAERIVDAIKTRRREVVIGFPEGLIARLSALSPGLVDRVLAPGDRKAARLFDEIQKTRG